MENIPPTVLLLIIGFIIFQSLFFGVSVCNLVEIQV